MFLDAREITERIRIALRVAAILLAAALVAWLTDADTAIFRSIRASDTLTALHPLFDAYSKWGPAFFYLPFLGVLVFGLLRKQPPWRTLGLAYLMSQLIGSVLLVHLIKLATRVPRPHAVHLPHAFFQVGGFVQSLHSSFPSSHAADAAIGALFAWALLRSRIASIAALAAVLLMALSRLLAGKHDLSDVLVGIALGIATASLVLRFYLLPRWEKQQA
ncbi:MAG: phosphatase PAP2 family protein [Thiobacillus sp.]